MDLMIEHEDVWVAPLDDKPGALAAKLAALAEAGADLDFVIARRAPEKPGTAVVFVTPLRGDAETDAATENGFSISSSLHSIRVEGEKEQGLGSRLTQALGEAGVNLRGLSAAAIGKRFVMHLALDTREESEKAAQILREM